MTSGDDPKVNGAAPVPQEGAVDRSASGLQYQAYQIGLNARGSALGLGRRVAPDPNVLFSNPPMSGAQFGGGHAKSVASFGAPEES